jgi:homocysteine S-methyltransferase
MVRGGFFLIIAKNGNDVDFSSFWQPFLKDRKFVVLDGGLATELERRGADLADPLWSAKLLLDDPALIRQVHLDYLRAGANVITSASYQASFAGFAKRGLTPSEAAALMVRSVRLAQEARSEFHGARPPLVAASIGCYGAFLHDGSEYRGDYGLSRQQLIAWHRPRFALLAGSGADLLACETIPCRVEAEALLALLAEFPGTPTWLSFSCRDESTVCLGESLAECLALTRGVPNIVAAGINCTPQYLIEPLLRSVAGATDRPLLVYPNGGDRWDAESRRWECDASAKVDWGLLAEKWFIAGARLIGGCCRTTPADIAKIARLSVDPMV